MPKKTTTVVPHEIIEQKIFLIRGRKVMLDRDLAQLYGVETKYLTRQVRRNLDRFPPDFLFVLTAQEFRNLKCQIGTSSWGGTRKLPFAFTEHGILMLSSVLKSKRAIQVNIQIMRAFIKLRQLMISHRKLAQKIEELERKFTEHDEKFILVFETIRRLIEEEEKPKNPIGFQAIKD